VTLADGDHIMACRGHLAGVVAVVRMGLARLPAGGQLAPLRADWLGGIGFTMSFSIATLAHGLGPLLDVAKLGTLMASLVAGIGGSLVLWATTRSSSEPGAG
jgi:NhaA family Na+:H+ antiporter